MRVAVTGHYGGLGKAIAERLTRDGHEIVGFSLENGYDISKPEDFERIVRGSLDCDVFVNCAHDRLHHSIEQVGLLTLMFYHWQAEEKHIISIGSDAPDKYSSGSYHSFVSKYRAAKAALDAATQEISALGKPCRVSIVRPGWMNSPTATKFEESAGVQVGKLEYDEVADVVAMIVDRGSEVTISSITLSRSIRNPDQPSKPNKSRSLWRRGS